MSDETAVAIERDPYECMDIFEHFSLDTRRELARQEWRPDTDSISESRRAHVRIELPKYDYHETIPMCPIAYCLWRENKLWTERPDYVEEPPSDINPTYAEVEGSPDGDDIAKMLLGLTYHEGYMGVPDDKRDAYEKIKAEAQSFIGPWDSGFIDDIERAACAHKPGETTV